MKMYTFTVVLFALALFANARIQDRSILIPFPPGCRSTLRVMIQGIGRASTRRAARARCKNECGRGVASFRLNKCPRLCGLPAVQAFTKTARAKVCRLCYPDSSYHVRQCRRLMTSGLRICRRDCDRNRPDKIKGLFVVRGTSGGVFYKVPSKILK